ncbi:MAG: site-specific DNA-methyltransferase [Dehalococcoidales bacterium]|nr:site-specific DNA-methyltransferase [Dehalococcoidales bacterium]
MIQLYQGDSREIAKDLIAPGSVDLIFTDPPYAKKYHYLYQWLGQEAERALKPDGFLFAYTGPYWKHEIMTMLGRYLDYFYDFVLVHGDTSILWQRKIVSGYKSILCYKQKGRKSKPYMNVLGKFSSSEQDKRFHSWGQSAFEARYYIDCFTKEGDLVVDYFLGSGTTAEVCKRLNRNFIGIENDAETFKIAQARLTGALGPREKGRQIELLPEEGEISKGRSHQGVG